MLQVLTHRTNPMQWPFLALQLCRLGTMHTPVTPESSRLAGSIMSWRPAWISKQDSVSKSQENKIKWTCFYLAMMKELWTMILELTLFNNCPTAPISTIEHSLKITWVDFSVLIKKKKTLTFPLCYKHTKIHKAFPLFPCPIHKWLGLHPYFFWSKVLLQKG